MTLIIYFNGNTFNFMNREKKAIRNALDGRDNETEKKIQTRELKMARTFLAIIIAFVICYLPCYISTTIDALEKIEALCLKPEPPESSDFIETLIIPKQNLTSLSKTSILPICCYIHQLWYNVLFYFGNVLITLNSSINVLLYGFTGKKFRSEAKKILCKPFTFSKCCSLSKLKTTHSIFRTFSNARDTQTTTVLAISRNPEIVT